MLYNRTFIYSLIGFFPFFFYAFYHYYYDNKVIGYISIINASLLLVASCIIYANRFKDEPIARWQSNAILFFISASVIAICYFIGLRGVAYIFPLTISYFFNFKLKQAAFYSLILVVCGLLAATYVSDSASLVRVLIPIIITIIIAYMYANHLEQHKRAFESEANHDYLTGLHNRRHFNRWLSQQFTQARQQNALALIFIDMDDFKHINDNHSHVVGDQYLIEIASRINKVSRSAYVDLPFNQYESARIAGDEFVIAIDGVCSTKSIEVLTDILLAEINKPMLIDNIKITPQASIGVSILSERCRDVNALVNEADHAMFEAKKRGKNQIVLFNDELAKHFNQRSAIINALKGAISNNEFTLHFMPIWDKKATRIAGAEVLIRTKNKLLQSVGPDKYIPLAEENNLITPIDLWVIEESFKYLTCIIKDFPDRKFVIAINISGLELTNSKFPSQVKRLLDKYQVPSEMIELEITETCFINCTQDNVEVLNELKAMGFKLALDDFGTGYTAFNQLLNFPVDTLKIDRSFVNAINQDTPGKQKNLVDVILSLAEIYQLKIVAEGVETHQQLSYLSALNCDFYQGYLLSKPLIWLKFYHLLETEKI
ncbi:hypothetical protein theurythT_18200 [Thalassotalea eurytherma]|uniref:Bifunctional diguanylate cyclase/phosphodiesterase n=1 Tax=Thalassotalea eurytherma TaxID=1144278 RepID=A0ABQ6H2F3_9GAMM|nr:hypothetical protein theurythT_18200 [Thalassotalea eurytherma]